MLDLITKVFVSGGSAKLDIPEPPSSLVGPDQVSVDMTKEERIEIYKQRLAVRRQKAEMYSLWCDTLYRLSLANHVSSKLFYASKRILTLDFSIGKRFSGSLTTWTFEDESILVHLILATWGLI